MSTRSPMAPPWFAAGHYLRSAAASRRRCCSLRGRQRVLDGDEHGVAVLLELRCADPLDALQLGERRREGERDPLERGIVEHDVGRLAGTELVSRSAKKVEGSNARRVRRARARKAENTPLSASR